MRRAFLTLVAACAAASPAAAQDVVRLKSGKVVSGTLQIDETDKEGFKVQRWDTGGTLYVRWLQISDPEKNRLLNRAPAEIGPAVDLIDGVSVLTDNRMEVGVLVREDANQILIKTSRSRTPVPVPRTALLKPYDKVKIRESDAYSTDEMIERRLAKANEKDYASMLDMGRFAAGLKLYERAKEFYQKASAADASKKEEIDAILAQNEILIREGRAQALLAEVKGLVEKVEYAKAVELAKKFIADFGDTETGKQNRDIVAHLEKEAKDWELKKAEMLVQKVPEMYKAKIRSLLSKYSGSRHKLSEARSQVSKFDEAVVKELGETLKSTPEEITTAWQKREKKNRTANYDDGSWIVKGGQDGGLDNDQKYTAPVKQQPNQGQNVVDQFGNRMQPRQRQQPQPKPVDLGKPLQKAEEWWASASQTDRKNWLEAEYAKTSSMVEKEITPKKCSLCQGEGMLKANRHGQNVEVKCSRCHGSKEDEIIIYR